MQKEQARKTVLETILNWSAQRPAWQQDGLRRIVVTGGFDDDAVRDAVALCKKAHGADGIELEPRPLLAAHLPANPGAGATVSLVSVMNVVGVNQLAPNQTLPLEPEGLTVIYGPNGAGKSGYARVLKRACRARHAGEIMPDAFNPPPAGTATAEIALVRGGAEAETINWIDSDKPDATPAVGLNDNFFARGGDSILAIAAVARARREGLDLAVQDIFRNQTVSELAALLEAAGLVRRAMTRLDLGDDAEEVEF
jgi:hypothetical protein